MRERKRGRKGEKEVSPSIDFSSQKSYSIAIAFSHISYFFTAPLIMI